MYSLRWIDKRQTNIKHSWIIVKSVMVEWAQISIEPVSMCIEFKDKAYFRMFAVSGRMKVWTKQNKFQILEGVIVQSEVFGHWKTACIVADRLLMVVKPIAKFSASFSNIKDHLHTKYSRVSKLHSESHSQDWGVLKKFSS